MEDLGGNEDRLERGLWLSAPSRGRLEAQLDLLKEKLLGRLVESVANTELVKELSRAATEAAALAWFTVCPILVLPALFEEKVRLVLDRWERQQRLRHGSRA